MFTDFTYDNLGIPRNMAIPDNADPAHFDLGLCAQPGLEARAPADVADKAGFLASLCGAFKVPTLRNIAKTAPYMHNGFFKPCGRWSSSTSRATPTRDAGIPPTTAWCGSSTISPRSITTTSTPPRCLATFRWADARTWSSDDQSGRGVPEHAQRRLHALTFRLRSSLARTAGGPWAPKGCYGVSRT